MPLRNPCPNCTCTQNATPASTNSKRLITKPARERFDNVCVHRTRRDRHRCRMRGERRTTVDSNVKRTHTYAQYTFFLTSLSRILRRHARILPPPWGRKSCLGLPHAATAVKAYSYYAGTRLVLLHQFTSLWNLNVPSHVWTESSRISVKESKRQSTRPHRSYARWS